MSRPDCPWRGAFVLTLAMLPALATAQSAPARDRAAEATAKEVQERTPPAIEHLPELELPPGLEIPPGALEATVRIGEDGRATLERSSAEGELRARIEALLTRARFRPARIGGKPREARVRVRFAVAGSAADAAAGEVEQLSAPSAAPEPEAAPSTEEPLHELGARAEVDRPQPTARALKLAEMREVPGAFGDPFRVLDTLPGVVPVFSGLPYVYVRGAPPAGTVYLYDGIAVPSLFHLALGPAVIHPAMIGDLQFYSAVPPARYGRRTGGVFAAEGPDYDPHAPARGELELRLIDTQAMADVPLGDGRVVLAGRYGYPGLLLSVFSSEAVLAYWDYQMRLRQALSGSDRIELAWFGSYDKVGEKKDPDENIVLEFHRAEVRVIRERTGFELGFALQGGYERSSLSEEVAISAVRLGPRLWSVIDLGGGARVRMGADMLATIGKIHELEPEHAEAAPPAFMPGVGPLPPGDPRFPEGMPPKSLPTVPGPAPVSEDDSLFDDPLYAAVAGRNQAGAYTELELPLGGGFRLEPGMRFDAWFSGGDTQIAFEPRLVAAQRLSEVWELHAAAGLGHQLAALPIPLPGFSDVALEHGLQESIQGEVGVAVTPEDALRFELELFYVRHSDLLLPELFIECDDNDSDNELCPDRGWPRGDVHARGLELFAKRDVTETLSGWVSYTLGWAEGRAGSLSFTPEYDVRHVGNLVAQWRIGGGFSTGVRLHYRTGKVRSETLPLGLGRGLRVERRLPGFFRADAQITYAWDTSWGRMRAALEWMNVTMSREPTSLNCHYEVFQRPDDAQCKVDYGPAIFFPNLSLRGEW